MDDNIFDTIREQFQNTQRRREQMDDYLSKMQSEPCCQVPEVGDSVIVAVGLINRGHLWMREECEVTGVTGTCIRVKSVGTNVYKAWEEWIDPILVLDVI